MLYYFDGSMSECLLDAYPDIGLKKDKFVLRMYLLPYSFILFFFSFSFSFFVYFYCFMFLIVFILISGQRWSEVETRVNFFSGLAEKLKFDPLSAENWYTVSSDDASKMKVIERDRE